MPLWGAACTDDRGPMSPRTITVTTADAKARPWRRGAHAAPLVRRIVGGFFLVMGGVHLGVVGADPQAYQHFADHAVFTFVTTAWHDIVMARPEVYGLLLMAGEVVLGTCLLVGGRAAALGWVGVIGFHALLMLFGLWAWAWSLPVLAVLIPLARRDLERGCFP